MDDGFRRRCAEKVTRAACSDERAVHFTVKTNEKEQVMTRTDATKGKSHAGNPYMRFDEGKCLVGGNARRGSLLYKLIAIFIGALAFAFTSIAEDMTFPLNGGYLDSATDWGGAIPSLSDTVTLDKPGVYRISEDITLNRLNVRSGGVTNDFTGCRISFMDKTSVRCEGVDV